MAKPIFLVGYPHEIAQSIEIDQMKLEHKMPDYYPLAYIHNKKDMEFKVFYEKDFDEVKFEELKQIVKDAVSSYLKKE